VAQADDLASDAVQARVTSDWSTAVGQALEGCLDVLVAAGLSHRDVQQDARFLRAAKDACNAGRCGVASTLSAVAIVWVRAEIR
jgi:hypothetical protein